MVPKVLACYEEGPGFEARNREKNLHSYLDCKYSSHPGTHFILNRQRSFSERLAFSYPVFFLRFRDDKTIVIGVPSIKPLKKCISMSYIFSVVFVLKEKM
jgi:hypothetical protein